ncbi:MAG: SDR family oxidoreductase [Proteobacteria bacterium]|nr:SDR family oxidoreductase [Pseudomonadota bacterium]
MNILVTGAGGMLGRKLFAKLLAAGSVAERPITSMLLADMSGLSDVSPSDRVQTVAADVSQRGVAESLIESRPELIFHLAAVVSGEAEADFEKGYRVNLDGTRALLEAIRKIGPGYCPRFVFASSVAVFGSPLPDVIEDDQGLTPLTSYGTQKAICELLLADYSRRGFIDGIGIRLPTIAIRPGKPNKAASGFFSNILREPLAGTEAILPVDESVRHWFASPRAAVGFIVHAAALDTSKLGFHRSLNLPGLSATVGEQLEALRRVAGERAVALVKRVPDPQIRRMIGSWPRSFDARRAKELGFVAEASFDEIIRVHIEDELGGVLRV